MDEDYSFYSMQTVWSSQNCRFNGIWNILQAVEVSAALKPLDFVGEREVDQGVLLVWSCRTTDHRGLDVITAGFFLKQWVDVVRP